MKHSPPDWIYICIFATFNILFIQYISIEYESNDGGDQAKTASWFTNRTD